MTEETYSIDEIGPCELCDAPATHRVKISTPKLSGVYVIIGHVCEYCSKKPGIHETIKGIHKTENENRKQITPKDRLRLN